MARPGATLGGDSPGEASTASVLHVDPATIVIFSVLFSPAALMAALLAWRGQQLWDAAVLGLSYVALLYWMCGRTVELVPGRLVYRVLFRRKEIELSRVSAARVVARPAPTLELLREGSRSYTAAFIVKPFTRSGVAAILHHIRACSPDVKLDPVAQDMADGRFDSITRETIRAMNVLRLALLIGLALTAAAVIRFVIG